MSDDTIRTEIRSVPLKLENVSKKFEGGVLAVDGVTLDIPAGTLITFLGPSGCGKTTTLRLIAGLERPTKGRIFIDDEDVTSLPVSDRDIGMVFQNYALFPHMSVFENVAYGLRVQRRPQEEVRRRVVESLELVGMGGYEGRSIQTLSGGQQQRVALARALVMHPKVLLFDEPLSNLDAKLRKFVRQEIRELQQRLQITSVYVTHDQEEALAISDLIVVMNEGRIEQIGTPREIYTRPASRFVADFVGMANFLAATYDGQRAQIGDYGFPFRQDTAPGPVTVMVRPEAVEASTDGGGLGAAIREITYTGNQTELLFDTPAGQVLTVVLGDAADRWQPGQDVYLRFRTTGVHLLPPEAVREATAGDPKEVASP